MLHCSDGADITRTTVAGKIEESTGSELLLRVGATVGLDMVSEGTEEYLQEILMPVFRNIALGEDNEFRLVTPDAVYSYMLGALTAGFIESGNAAFSNTHARDAGAGILQAGKGDTLLQSAFMLDPGSETYKLADQIAAGFVQSNDINIGNLFVSYIRDGGSADILAPDESDIISNAVNDVGNTVVDDMVDNWNGVDSENNDADGNWDDVISDALAGNDETGYNGSATEGAGDNDLFRGDDLLYEERRPNGISKSHLNSVGDLVPANIDGIYKDRPVTVTEHILGGYRKGAKGNSPYTSFTNDKGIIATYGNNIIKVDLNGLIRDINAGKVRGVEVLTPEQIQTLIKSDVQESEYWRELALKWATRDKEHLIKGIIPQKYITITTNGGI